MEKRHLIPRLFYQGEQYVSFFDMILSIKELSNDYREAGYNEAAGALGWLAEQLEFSLIVDGIRNEQE